MTATRSRQTAQSPAPPLPPFAPPARRTAPSGRPEKPYQVPKRLGAAVDALYTTRQTRLAIQAQVQKLAEREALLREHLIATLPKSDATGAAGKLARASITSKRVPQVEDWDKLYEHVRKTRDFSLLQRRLADAAVTERWDAGKEVPGVGHFTAIGVSVNKL